MAKVCKNAQNAREGTIRCGGGRDKLLAWEQEKQNPQANITGATGAEPIPPPPRLQKGKQSSRGEEIRVIAIYGTESSREGR